VQIRLKRLKPGSCSAIAALKCSDGFKATSPDAIAGELRRHWEEIFRARPHNETILSRWLQEELGTDSPSYGMHEDLAVSIQDIIAVVKRSPTSMPGPNGIPYKAWKRLGHIAENLFF